jgi:SAM-dependent methyltransferase
MENKEFEKCLFCGSTAVLKNRSITGYQQPDVFKIYHCPHCYTAFSLPRVETKNIYESIYENGEQVPGYDRYWKYAKKVKKSRHPMAYLSKAEEMYWSVGEAIKIVAPNKETAKILEIGSGLGYLTYSLRCEHYDIIGIDVSTTAIEEAIKRFGDYYLCADLFDYAQQHAASYDVVILTEVIEHVENPLDFIKAIKLLLNSGGHAIITTPNKTFYSSEVVWGTEHPPVHSWWLGEESMKYAAKINHLTIEFVNFSNYYRNRPLVINPKKIIEGESLPSVLGSNGALISRKKSLAARLRFVLIEVGMIKRFYNYLKRWTVVNPMICKDRGTILCAIMKK